MAGKALDLLGLGIHGKYRTAESVTDQAGDDLVADLALLTRRADNGHGLRIKERL